MVLEWFILCLHFGKSILKISYGGYSLGSQIPTIIACEKYKTIPNVTAEMAKPWRYFFFLLWFAYLIVASILLFTRGFLLSRVTQTSNSTCIPYSVTPCTVRSNTISRSNGLDQHCLEGDQPSIMNHLHSASHVCLPPKARVVLIIIDAFRYDFALFDPAIEEPLAFQNKLPIINHLLKTHADSTRLYKFIADPPTTTMQRLKALTTGSLPTFIDAGSNFATAEINEDNIIDQLVKKTSDIVFMGDDTWVSLYPSRFTRSYPFPSFNVFDLDTVDTGVAKHLHPELMEKDWNLLIAHFLGVDHCGHRYGPTHPEMTRKLTEMNQVIEDVIENLDEHTMLFVIGDHGMTSTGDHGGESMDEISSAMFVYSKTHLITTEEGISNETIKQVDLVPTLATILGVPVPYANLGSIVLNALPISNKTEMPFPEWQTLLFAVWSNVQQMMSYIKQYAITSETFSQERLQNLYEKFALLNARVRTIGSENEFTVFTRDAMEYTKMLREMCEEVWVQFDSYSMSRGLLLIFISIFLVYMIVSGIPSSQLPEIFMSSFLPCSYVALLIAIVVGAACFYLSLVDNLLATIFFSTGIVSVVMLAVLVMQNWDVIAIHWYDLSRHRTNTDLAFRLTFLLSWCGLLSNSYIVEEGYVSLFLLTTILVLISHEQSNQKKPATNMGTSNQKPKWNWTKIKLLSSVFIACTLVRLSSSWWRCREEQQWCATYISKHTPSIKPGSTAARAEYLMTLVTVAVFVTATRNWLRSCGNLVGLSSSVFLVRYAPTVMVVCTGGYWVLHGLPKDTKNKLVVGWQTDYLAWVVYVLVIAGVASIVLKPLCIYIIPKKKDASVHDQDNVIPQLFNRVKGLFNEKCNENSDSEVPIVCGLATVYSAAFVAVSVYVCLLLVLLFGDVMAPSAVLLYFCSAVVLTITAISRHEKAYNIAQLFEVPNSCILAWTLLSVYFFYASGHQATFPNIAWEAAFVGTGGIFTNNFIPAALVIINTFGSYILMGITLPLLFIAPFTLYVMFPSLCPKKNEAQNLQKDILRGEILLYENDGAMMNGVLVMSCKYILFHAVRVFVSMLAATIHCRHLMVWKIFAPKLIFEAIGMLVTLGSVLLGYLLLMRVNFKVNSLVMVLNKKSR